MPANLSLALRGEFLTAHMRGTAIELRNRQGSGWTQRDPDELLRITYPTGDVQRALTGISTVAQGKPLVFLGQRGRGKSHIMALLHHAIESPEKVGNWAHQWGAKPGFEPLAALTLPRGFMPITETLSNQEYRTLWDLIFQRHPRGEFYRGKHANSGNAIPAKSLLQDLFSEKPTVLVLDEFQTWFDGLHDEPGDSGLKRRQWAFNFVQILSELAKERPDLLMLVVSVRDTTTEGFRQINRISPLVINFQGETAKEDRKRLLLHRLFENRAHFSVPAIEQITAVYAQERIRLLHAGNTDAEKDRLRREGVAAWPFAPELLGLLDDHILMAESAQDKRDLIRILAELFNARGALVPLLTPSDFLVTDDQCGVLTLLDSFAITVDQEHLREKAMRNLQALQAASVATENAAFIISGIWIRSLSATNIVGATREELQLDLTRDRRIDDNAFAAELATIVENSFNIHEVGTTEKRYCFKLEENPLSKVKANAKNDNLFEPDTPTAPGLLPIMKDQAFMRQVLEHQLRSPDSPSEPPSRVVALDPNWDSAPWANVPVPDQPEKWEKPVLLVLPVSPGEPNATLGSWLAKHVSTRRNMLRFLLPKAGLPSIYDDPDLRRLARCALLAKNWKESDPIYAEIFRRFDKDLRRELAERFDRFAILHRWNYQQPAACEFSIEPCTAAPEKISKSIEESIRTDFFAPEDFQNLVLAAARRGETMKQVLAQLREPPAKPEVDAIPFLGEHVLYEQVIRICAQDQIAMCVNAVWYRADPGETEDQAFVRLKCCFRSGREMEAVQLGLPSQTGGAGVTIPTSQTTPARFLPADHPSAGLVPATTEVTEPDSPLDPTTAPMPLPAVIRQSNGAKSGINLLGDIERWGLPDAERITAATFTLHGLSVRDLRELCTRLPPKILAELQITSDSESPRGTGS